MRNKVVIPTQDYQLHGRLYSGVTGDTSRPAALFFSGWNAGGGWTTNDLFAAHCARKFGIICLTVYLRGMGSPGNIQVLTRADFLADAEATYDYLAVQPGVDRTSISVVGESFGAYLGCVLSRRRLVRALALRVPTDFPAEGFSDRPQVEFVGSRSLDWKSRSHHFAESPALCALHEFGGNVLLVASGRDKIVPMKTTENYVAAMREAGRLEFCIMSGAGHALLNPFHQRKYLKWLTGWFGRRVLADV